jgi:enamine deaminase RidA (YjgF/YER057c/UK114 family)
MTRQNISSGAVWEDIVGYSRAVRVGNIIEVAGTVSVENDILIGEGNMYEQTKCILLKIQRTLHEAGATMNDVIRTRIYVTDISRWDEVGKAHGEFFKDVRPASTMVEVKALIHPAYLVEIEVSALLQ